MTKNNIVKLLEILSDELVAGYGGEEYRPPLQTLANMANAMYAQQDKGFWLIIGEDHSGVMAVTMTNGKEKWRYKDV